MTDVLKSSMYAWTSKRCGEMRPGPAPSFWMSAAARVSVIARSVFGLPQPGPNEVTGRDDADWGGRRVCYDEAVDSVPFHILGGLFEGRGGSDGERRLGHDLPDRQARPVGTEVLVRSSPNEVGLTQHANQDAVVIQDRKTSDLVAVEDSGGLCERSRSGDRNWVGSHGLANRSSFGHRASPAGTLATPAGSLPAEGLPSAAIAAVTSITPS